MKRSGRRQDRERPDVLLSVGAGLRLLASFLFMVWTIQAATAVQNGLAFTKGQDTLAAAEPTAQPTILVRDFVRHLGAEASRFKSGAYAHGGETDGKPFAPIPDLHVQFEAPTRALLWLGSEIRPNRPPIRAFDARGPPSPTA